MKVSELIDKLKSVDPNSRLFMPSVIGDGLEDIAGILTVNIERCGLPDKTHKVAISGGEPGILFYHLADQS